MVKSSKASAGLLLYRRSSGALELFLAHPGGPFWHNRDAGAWTIPKGVCRARRRPAGGGLPGVRGGDRRSSRPDRFLPLGSIRQKAGKLVHGWAWEGDADVNRVTSNTMRTEWPRGSGRLITFPEVDRCAWYDPASARQKINPAQARVHRPAGGGAVRSRSGGMSWPMTLFRPRC